MSTTKVSEDDHTPQPPFTDLENTFSYRQLGEHDVEKSGYIYIDDLPTSNI